MKEKGTPLMERLLTQTGTWIEKVAPENPKDNVTEKTHSLGKIRVSISSRATRVDATGRSYEYSATLFFAFGFSSCDEKTDLPGIKDGDEIISPLGITWTVRGVDQMFAPSGDLHHLEVRLA